MNTRVKIDFPPPTRQCFWSQKDLWQNPRWILCEQDCLDMRSTSLFTCASRLVRTLPCQPTEYSPRRYRRAWATKRAHILVTFMGTQQQTWTQTVTPSPLRAALQITIRNSSLCSWHVSVLDMARVARVPWARLPTGFSLRLGQTRCFQRCIRQHAAAHCDLTKPLQHAEEPVKGQIVLWYWHCNDCEVGLWWFMVITQPIPRQSPLVEQGSSHGLSTHPASRQYQRICWCGIVPGNSGSWLMPQGGDDDSRTVGPTGSRPTQLPGRDQLALPARHGASAPGWNG